MTESLRALNLCLLRKGVTAMPLRYRDGKALIYLCRIEMLDADLRDPLAEAILREYGYPEGSPIRKIAWLIRRLRECEAFPHEIGLFLGYPPADVRGFMEGKACKCTGLWKVFETDEQEIVGHHGTVGSFIALDENGVLNADGISWVKQEE